MPGEDQVALKLLTNIENLTKELQGENGIAAQLKALKEQVKGLENLDIKKTLEEFDRMKAWFTKQTQRLTVNSPFYVPGIEDELPKFSLIRTMIAIREKNWEQAKHEESVIKAMAEKASQVVDIGSRGGFFLPDLVMPEVILAIYIASSFVNLTGNAADGSTSLRLIEGVTAESGKMHKAERGCVAYWVGEEDQAAESFMTGGDVDYKLKELSVLTAITERMRMYGANGFEQALRQDMIMSAAEKLDWTCAYGSGSSNMPLGIINNPKIQRFSAATGQVQVGAPQQANNVGGELDYDGIDEMMGAVEDTVQRISPNARIHAAGRYFRRLKQQKVSSYNGQTGQQDYLVGFPRIPDSRLAEIIGPFSKNNKLKSGQTPGQSAGWTPAAGSSAKFGDVLFGNWDDVVLVRGAGLTIKDDGGNGKGFASGKIYMKLNLYADLMYRRPESIIHCPDARMRK